MIEQTRNSKTTLVLGGTGKTGRRVAQRLKELGVPVRLGSRSAQPPFDWEDQNTWASALQGVDAVYVSFYPDLAAPGASEAIRAFSRLAATNGVRRLVLLSGRGEEEAQACEKVVQSSGCKWTIVRASWFNQNFSEGAMLDAVLSGEVALPVGDVGEPFIDVEDIADVAVAALTEESHANQLYEVTGPRLLSFAQAMQEISQATGHEVRFVTVSIEQYVSMMRAYDVPEEVIAQLVYLFTEVLDGRNAHLSDGVQRALGREPRDFADFARAAAASDVWAG
ncbi:MAG: NAD(P)H-binding protein [Ktedonobacteraceae bacterium]|nr:NAD(P)H-binding protein [Ktedonobacteraceae bacterium]